MSILLDRYRTFLPVTERTPILSLGEGATPLVRADSALEERLGGAELFFKLEGCNPTGSFKDRGMVLAVAKAREAGSRALICASTGNTSSSAAAFAARFGLECIVLIPSGKIALGKLAQALIYGATVLAIDGNYDRGLEVVRDLRQRHDVTVVNSINPYRLEGQKTAAFEIVDDLGDAPDIVAIPVGNAGNITAYWRGFREYRAAGRSHRLPKMYGMQAAGAASMVEDRVIEHPETFATAIRIGNPANRAGARAAQTESGGCFTAVTDDEIRAAYTLLASTQGIFSEPASAASLAGLLKLAAAGHSFRGRRIVAILTGNGLKDPDSALASAGQVREVAADLEAIESSLGWRVGGSRGASRESKPAQPLAKLGAQPHSAPDPRPETRDSGLR